MRHFSFDLLDEMDEQRYWCRSAASQSTWTGAGSTKPNSDSSMHESYRIGLGTPWGQEAGSRGETSAPTTPLATPDTASAEACSKTSPRNAERLGAGRRPYTDLARALANDVHDDSVQPYGTQDECRARTREYSGAAL